MDDGNDILTKLWTDVINVDATGKWLDTFAHDPKAAEHPIPKAREVIAKLAKMEKAKEDLGRIGRARRYEVCFGTLYALDDPGLVDGKLAGLDKSLAKMQSAAARRKSDEADFFDSLWEMITPTGDATDWTERAAEELADEPFGDTGPAVKRLLAQQ